MLKIIKKQKGKKRTFSPSLQRVMDKLQSNGVTSIDDYPRGFAIRSRISDLKDKGVPIMAVDYDPSNPDCRLKKYILIAK